MFRFLSSFPCPSAEQQQSHYHHHIRHQQLQQPISFSSEACHTVMMRRSPCNENDVPLNLSSRSTDSGSQHHADCDPHQSVGSSQPYTAYGADGNAWRQNHRYLQQQQRLRRPESSPCLNPEPRKSSSSGNTITTSTSCCCCSS